jgi:hypothetical protein
MSKREQRKGRLSFPRWALITCGVMIAVGVVLLATREARERVGLIAALNDGGLKLVEDQNGKEVANGFSEGFGLMALDDHRGDYERLLGYCETRPELALEVFRRVREKGTWRGRALACHMAFFLAQKDALTGEDLEEMAKLLDQEKVELRRVVQRELSQLIVLRDGEKASLYTKIEAPAGTKDPFEAKTAKVSLLDAPPGTQWLSIQWSNPEACQAWWKAFGPRARWDGKLKRFVITD